MHTKSRHYQSAALRRPPPVKSSTRHQRSGHPVPTGFVVTIEPPTPTLDPGVSVTITVSVDPPAGFVGKQPLNINAFHEQGFAGGVTLTTMKEP